MSYLIFHNDEQSGPFEAEQIRDFVESGELPETVFIWQEGMADWTPANSIIAFAQTSLAVPSLPASSMELQPVIDSHAVEVVGAAGRIERTFDDAFRKLVSDEQDPALCGRFSPR